MGKKSKKKVQWRRLSLSDTCSGSSYVDCNNARFTSDEHLYIDPLRSPSPSNGDYSKENFSNGVSYKPFHNARKHYRNSRELTRQSRGDSAERTGEDVSSGCPHSRIPFSKYNERGGPDKRRHFRHFSRQASAAGFYINNNRPPFKRRWSEEGCCASSGGLEDPQDGISSEGADEVPNRPWQPVHTVFINNEEYTRIQTPRQEVIFKKGSLDRRRDWEEEMTSVGSESAGGNVGACNDTGSDSLEDALSTSVEDFCSDGQRDSSNYDEANMFSTDPDKPPLAGIVMQEAFPGGPMVSVPVHWTPFLDPNLIPGDVALTTLDPSFTQVIDPISLPTDCAYVLPVQHDANGCPINVRVKIDSNGAPIEIEPSVFTVSLSSLNPRQQEVILQQVVTPNTIFQNTLMTPSTKDSSPVLLSTDLKDGNEDTFEPKVPEEMEPNNHKDSEDSSSDSQYASMSESSTTPTTPAGELSFLQEASSRGSCLERKETPSEKVTAEGSEDKLASGSCLSKVAEESPAGDLSREDSLLDTSELEEHCDSPFDSLPCHDEKDKTEFGSPNDNNVSVGEESISDPNISLNENLENCIEMQDSEMLSERSDILLEEENTNLTCDISEHKDSEGLTSDTHSLADTLEDSKVSDDSSDAERRKKRSKKSPRPKRNSSFNSDGNNEPVESGKEIEILESSDSPTDEKEDSTSSNIEANMKSRKAAKKLKKDRKKMERKVFKSPEAEENTKDISPSTEVEDAKSDERKADELDSSKKEDLEECSTEMESKPGYVVVPILTPYYDPAVFYGYPLVMQDQHCHPRKDFSKRKRKKYKNYQENNRTDLFLDSKLYTGEPFVTTPEGYLVPMDQPQLCQLHGYQYVGSPYSPVLPNYVEEGMHYSPTEQIPVSNTDDKTPAKNIPKPFSACDDKPVDSNNLSESESEEVLLNDISLDKKTVEAAHCDKVSEKDSLALISIKSTESRASDITTANIPETGNPNNDISAESSVTNVKVTDSILEETTKTETLIQSTKTNDKTIKDTALDESKKDADAIPKSETAKADSKKFILVKKSRYSSKNKRNEVPLVVPAETDPITIKSPTKIKVFESPTDKNSKASPEDSKSSKFANNSNKVSFMGVQTKKASRKSKGKLTEKTNTKVASVNDDCNLDDPESSNRKNKKNKPSIPVSDTAHLEKISLFDITEKDNSSNMENILNEVEKASMFDISEKDFSKNMEMIQNEILKNLQSPIIPKKDNVKFSQPSQSTPKSSLSPISYADPTLQILPKVMTSPKVEEDITPVRRENRKRNNRHKYKLPQFEILEVEEAFSAVTTSPIGFGSINLQLLETRVAMAHKAATFSKHKSPSSIPEDSANNKQLKDKVSKKTSKGKRNQNKKENPLNENAIEIIECNKKGKKKDSKSSPSIDENTSNKSNVKTCKKSKNDTEKSQNNSKVNANCSKGSPKLNHKSRSHKEQITFLPVTNEDLIASNNLIECVPEPNSTEKFVIAKSASSDSNKSLKIEETPVDCHGVKEASVNVIADFVTDSNIQLDLHFNSCAELEVHPVSSLKVVCNTERGHMISSDELVTYTQMINENVNIEEEVSDYTHENEVNVNDASPFESTIQIKDTDSVPSSYESILMFSETKSIDKPELCSDESIDSFNNAQSAEKSESCSHESTDSIQQHESCSDHYSECIEKAELCSVGSIKSLKESELDEEIKLCSNKSTALEELSINKEIESCASLKEPKLVQNTELYPCESPGKTDSTEENECCLVEKRDQHLKNLGVTEAVKRWIREVTPEKAFILHETNPSLFLNTIESEEEFIDDDLEGYVQETENEPPKNVICNPIASPSEEGAGAHSNRVANKLQGFLVESLNNSDKGSCGENSIVSRTHLYSESSFSLPHSLDLSFDEDDLSGDPKKYDPTIYSKYYQLGVGVDSPTPVPSSRATSHTRENSLTNESECSSNVPHSEAASKTEYSDAKSNSAEFTEIMSPLTSGIGSSLASTPANTPSHKPKLTPYPLKNLSAETGPLPVCCSVM